MSGIAPASTLVGPAGRPMAAPALPPSAAVRIVLFCAIGLAVNFAPAFLGTFPIMLKPMQADLGFSRTALTTGYSLAVACLGVAGPLVGRVVDRRGQRLFLIGGIPALALCLALFSTLPPHALPLYLGLCVVTGIVAAASFQALYYSIIPPRFNRRLGIALALAGVGGSLGIAAFAAFAQALVGAHGWRSAYQGIAAVSLVVGTLNLLVLRVPRGARRSASEHATITAALDGPRLATVVRLPVFWRLIFSYLLIATMINGVFVHLVPMLTDRGTPAADAAVMLVYLGATAVVARVICGLLLLRINPARLGASVFVLGVGGAALLLHPDSHARVVAAVVLLGTAFGAEGELLNYTGRFTFGLRAQGTLLAMLTTAFLLGNLFGPMLMSIGRDQTGSYRGAQLLLIGFGLIAAALHAWVRPAAGVISVGTGRPIPGAPRS